MAIVSPYIANQTLKYKYRNTPFNYCTLCISSLNIFIRTNKSLIGRESITEFYHINRISYERSVRGKKEVAESETGKGLKEKERSRERERVT